MNLKAILVGLFCFASGYGIALLNADDGLNNPSQPYNEIDSKILSENINKPIPNSHDDQFNALISQPNGHILSQATIDNLSSMKYFSFLASFGKLAYLDLSNKPL